MNKLLIKLTLIISSIMIIGSGYSYSQDETDAPKIKKLYIGMDINDAMPIVAELNGGEAKNKPDFFSLLVSVREIQVSADENDKVDSIFFPSLKVDELFNTGEMDFESFLQKFCESYKIPITKMKISREMRRVGDDDIKFVVDIWAKYASPQGWKVEVGGTKTDTLVMLHNIKMSSIPKERVMD